MVHEGLEHRRSIAEAKKHDCGFIEAEGSDECSLPLILLLDANVVVSPSDVKLHEKSGILHVID